MRDAWIMRGFAMTVLVRTQDFLNTQQAILSPDSVLDSATRMAAKRMVFASLALKAPDQLRQRNGCAPYSYTPYSCVPYSSDPGQCGYDYRRTYNNWLEFDIVGAIPRSRFHLFKVSMQS